MSQIDNLLQPSGRFQGWVVLLTLIVLSPISLFLLKGPAPGIAGPYGIEQKQAVNTPIWSKKFGNTTIKVQGLQAAERKWGLATREIGIKKNRSHDFGVENTKLKVKAGDA